MSNEKLTSYEVELELRLEKLNSEIIIVNRFYRKKIIGRFFAKRLNKLNQDQQSCFRELRDLIRKKHPEKFIRSNNNV